MSIYVEERNTYLKKVDNMNYFQWLDSHVIDGLDIPDKVFALLAGVNVLNNYHERNVKGKEKHNLRIANVAVSEPHAGEPTEFVCDSQGLLVSKLELISNLCSNHTSQHLQLAPYNLKSMYGYLFPNVVNFLTESGLVHDKEIVEALGKCKTNSNNLNEALSVVYNKVRQYNINPQQFAEYVEDLLPLQVVDHVKNVSGQEVSNKYNALHMDGTQHVVDRTDFPWVNYFTLGGKMSYLDECGELSNFARSFVVDKLLYGPEKYTQQLFNVSVKDILTSDKVM